ncbi:putative zinc-binding domain-containing protein, partial [Dysosmobacter welbionis]
RFWRVHFFHEVSSSRCQNRLPPSGDRFTGKVCLIHLNCIIRLELEAMGQKTLYVKGVFLVIIRCVAVEGMLGEIIFVGQKRADAAKLQDALAAI